MIAELSGGGRVFECSQAAEKTQMELKMDIQRPYDPLSPTRC